MGMTITEKILARASGRSSARPGDMLEVKADVLWLHESDRPRKTSLFKSLEDAGLTRVWDPTRIIAMIEHEAPPSKPKKAEDCAAQRQFAREQGIPLLEIGRAGIGHIVMIEKGFVRPGEVILGGDSHTCTYGAFGAFSTGIGAVEAVGVMGLGYTWIEVPHSIKIVVSGKLPPSVMGKDVGMATMAQFGLGATNEKAIEWCGPTIQGMDLDSRLALTNMSIEMVAVNSIMEPDDKVIQYVKQRTSQQFQPLFSDSDAEYEHVYELDVTHLEPQVSLPHSHRNVRPVSQVAGENINIDQAFIGTCNSSRIVDMRAAARILKGKKIHPRVRLIIIPGSHQVWRQCLQEGLLEVFCDADVEVCNPSCGPCGSGLDKGMIWAGETCISTGPRNFQGRMGHPDSYIYLANAATVAASAVAGSIVDPREFVQEV